MWFFWNNSKSKSNWLIPMAYLESARQNTPKSVETLTREHKTLGVMFNSGENGGLNMYRLKSPYLPRFLDGKLFVHLTRWFWAHSKGNDLIRWNLRRKCKKMFKNDDFRSKQIFGYKKSPKICTKIEIEKNLENVQGIPFTPT